MNAEQAPLSYGSYLQLEKLLDCQNLESKKYGAAAHDEMLFILVHQAYELWFKQILWELEAVLRYFGQDKVGERDIGRVVLHLGRVNTIWRVIVQQIDILETMTPLDFLDFRDYLIPASGFQSVQFREMENRLGLRRGDRLQYSDTPYTSRLTEQEQARVTAAEAEPSLFGFVDDWLARTPFLQFGDFQFWRHYEQAVQQMLAADERAIRENPTLSDEEKAAELRRLTVTHTHFDALFDGDKHRKLVEKGERRLSHEAMQAALLINLYRDEPILHLPFRLLTTLVDLDEQMTTWRLRHAQMVQRMIGAKIGTGGSSGHQYLHASALRHRVFGDLMNLSTYFVPRSALPALPPEVARTMDFRYADDA